MPKLPITLIKGDKVGENTDYRDALPQNMYAISKSIFGSNGYMSCFPGLTKLCEGSGIDRGGMYNERQAMHFRVSGNKLIQIDSLFNVTELGDVGGSGKASMAYSFNTQAIVANNQMFLYDLTNGFREVTDTDLGNPIDITWIDNYYFMTDGEYVFHTDLSDETSIDPLKYATAEFIPDRTLGVGKTSDNKAIVFGRYSIEYFVDTATANFAFSRVTSMSLKIGIVSTHAKCESGEKWFICGNRKNESIGIHSILPGIISKVSTDEIDKIISKYTEQELQDIVLESITENDTKFVLVHLPGETLCFNESINAKLGKEYAWTVLASGVGSGNYRAINGVYDPNLNRFVFGDKLDNRIGYLDNEVFSQYGETSELYLYSPFLNLETMSIDAVEIETIPGHTTLDDAKVAISISYDGHTYGTEHFEMYGLPSDYGKRFIVTRLGYVPSWIGFKFRGATKSKMAFALFNIEYS